MTAPEPTPTADERTTPAPVGAAVALDLDERVARYGAAIWDASRHDEGTISWAGANVVARAVIAVADAEARDRTAPASEPYDAGAVNESYEDGYDQGHADAHADGAAPDRLCKALARAEAAEAEVGTLRARLAAVEALADQWADRKRSDGMSGNAWIGLTLSGVAADLRAALATTGEGQ